MLQNKLLFNQSAVSLEISGLPDVSIDDSNDNVSIISQWKLMIIDKPLIEGNVNHLSSNMDAFYSYSNLLLKNENAFYESELIDINSENFITHNVILKSTKSNVEALNLKIGNSILSDIINCFDQLNCSTKIRKLSPLVTKYTNNRYSLKFLNKYKITNILIPPLLSLFSLIVLSSTFIYFYDVMENKEDKSLIYSK